MKKRVFQSILLILIISIVINPSLAVNSAREGAYLWFNTLLPALLPFLIISELFISSGFVEFFGRILGNIMRPIFNVPGSAAFPLLVSSISGYPIGAKLSSDLRKKNYISRVEANRLISFTSTSGPSFILGTILIGMLNLPELKLLMILPHYLGIITVGLIFRFYNIQPDRKSNSFNKSPKVNEKIYQVDKYPQVNSIGKLISTSVKEGMDSIILIGGFIIVYAVIIEIFLQSNLIIRIVSSLSSYTKINPSIIQAYLAGILELTTGCKKISILNINPLHKIILLNSLIAWGGLSILSQAINFISQTDISIKVYIFSKFLHSIFTSLYTYLIYLVKFKDTGLPTFNPFTSSQQSSIVQWLHSISISTQLSLTICVFFMVTSLLLSQVKSK